LIMLPSEEFDCSVLKLSVTIPCVETFYKDDKPFVVYSVRISHGYGDDVVSWRIFHEFKHFSDLHDQLKKKYPKEALRLHFPPKFHFINKIIPSDDEIEKRRLELQDYLQRMVDCPVLRNDEQVKICLFLRESNFISRYQTLTRLKNRKFPISVVDPFLENTSKTSSKGKLMKSKSSVEISMRDPPKENGGGDGATEVKGKNQLRSFLSSASLLKYMPSKKLETASVIPSNPTDLCFRPRGRPRSNNAVIYPNRNYVREKTKSIPMAISKSIDFLLRSGLDVEGIFEAPVENSPKIHTYMKSFHEGMGEFVTFRYVSEAAGCLLAYLASLPEPLLCHELHLCFLEIDDDPACYEDQKVIKCRNLIRTLPGPTFELVCYVIEFFATIVDRCKDRERGLEKTAFIIAPILFQREVMDSDFPAAKNISKILVKHFTKLVRKS